MQFIKSYINQHEDRFLNELIELLKIPSISADSAYKNDILKTAEVIATSVPRKVWTLMHSIFTHIFSSIRNCLLHVSHGISNMSTMVAISKTAKIIVTSVTFTEWVRPSSKFIYVSYSYSLYSFA